MKKATLIEIIVTEDHTRLESILCEEHLKECLEKLIKRLKELTKQIEEELEEELEQTLMKN